MQLHRESFEAWQQTRAAVTRLLALPTSFAPALHATSTPAEAEGLLRQAIRAAVGELADPEEVG